MKSISLYVDKDTYLTRMHPFTKLCYILTAVAASLITGKLWAFAIFIGISLVMLISGKIMKKVFPLIAFSIYRKFLKSSEIVYNRLEIKNDITKERRGLRHDVAYEVFCFGLG